MIESHMCQTLHSCSHLNPATPRLSAARYRIRCPRPQTFNPNQVAVGRGGARGCLSIPTSLTDHNSRLMMVKMENIDGQNPAVSKIISKHQA